MSVLEVRDLVVQFPAVRALDQVSVAFEQGEIHGIIGENGAGKSTMMRVIAGLQRPTSGQLLLDGQPVHFRTSRDAMESGVAMIHQELNLVNDLSAGANIFLGSEPRKGLNIDDALIQQQSAELLKRVGAKFGPSKRVGDLSLAEKQLVEIAKALRQNARVLIMDEPTAVLSEEETATLFNLVGELKAAGVCVLYISHRLVELDILCDRITVLRDGAFVCTVLKGELSQSELASRMVGREFSQVFPTKHVSNETTPILHVQNLGDGKRVHSASFTVAPGEILGLAGLIGAGRTEVGEMIAGLRRVKHGTLTWKGQSVTPNSPRSMNRLGIAYVSEDRKDAGLHLQLDAIQNVTMANLSAFGSLWMDKNSQETTTSQWIKDLDIRVGDPEAAVLFLSGGNQQKVSVAKWLETKPQLLILDEPTRGVDIGAKSELYQLIQKLALDGLACIVISSELPELLGLCHRILVLREGTIVGEMNGDAATEEAIMQLAAGATA